MLTPDSFPSYKVTEMFPCSSIPGRMNLFHLWCGRKQMWWNYSFSICPFLLEDEKRSRLKASVSDLIGGRTRKVENIRQFSVVCCFVRDRFVGVKLFWLIFLIFCPHVIWSQRWFAVLRSTLWVSVVKWLPPKCPALRDEALINTTVSLMSAMGFDHTFCVLASFSFHLGQSC